MIKFYKNSDDLWIVGVEVQNGKGDWSLEYYNENTFVKVFNDNIKIIDNPITEIIKDDSNSKYANYAEFSTAVSPFFVKASSGDASWGSITGDVEDQEDLTNRLLPEGGTANQVPKKQVDGSVIWAADANTTYTAMTAAEATTGTSTTSRVVSAKVLNDKIVEMLPSPFSLTTTGTSGAATYNSNTLNIPIYANTTYSAITTAEIDAGSSTSSRTITAQRAKYIIDKAVNELLSGTTGLLNLPGYDPTKKLHLISDEGVLKWEE